MTALLIHGTGAFDLALDKASSYDTHYEYGGDSLTTNDAREAIQKMSYPIVGVEQFAVVIGAVDKARGSATDALLKSIEEHEDFVAPILWATALMDVPSTIRSRCRCFGLMNWIFKSKRNSNGSQSSVWRGTMPT